MRARPCGTSCIARAPYGLAERASADQLTVDPNPLLQIDDETRAGVIKMTQQEVAVALSHIGVWRLIASGDVPKPR